MTKNEQAIRSTGRRYEAWCSQCNHQAWPVSATSLSAYILFRCDELNGSSKSLRKWISHIKRCSGRFRHPWLDVVELDDVGKLVAHLEYLDRVPIRRVRPLTVEIIKQLSGSETVSEYDLMMMAVGHDSLQRGGELCSGYTAGDLVWSEDRHSVTITLARSKCHRKGGPQTILIKDYGPLSGTRLLRRHFKTNRLWSRPEAYVFPSCPPHKPNMDWSKPRTTVQFRTSVKRAVRSIGLDPRQFGGHSPRAGGATDLFRAKVFYPNIKKFGRWRSDAALVYYRDEDAVAQAATDGFASLLRPVPVTIGRIGLRKKKV